MMVPDRISVIIPCYNHGRYLHRAVESITSQHYADTEIIIVDDGSTDDTRQQSATLQGAKYIHQNNQGLSAARNRGITESTGEFLVFLDADDWLATNAFDINIRYLKNNEQAAFVSGGHYKVDPEGNILEEVRQNVTADHYGQLLQGNYIGMHATVMYRRWVFDKFTYDTSLRACEDYDIYLRITRTYPVIHHSHIIAWYLIHGKNMSADKELMLSAVYNVLERQIPHLKASERALLENGKKIWKEYYQPSKPRNMKKILKRLMPDLVKRLLLKNYIPAVGKIRTGDFKRLRPFSTQFGYDRGGPVDRYYIENFLELNKAAVRGRILEIGDNEYTLRYGGSKITSSDILHIDSKNEKATIIGDLSSAPQIQDNTYDCIILTQTLHLIYDFKGAISTCYRILKPGGTLLMTVPGITHIDQGEWKANWLWAFTGASIQRLLSETFKQEASRVDHYGNVYAAAAFLYGMGQHELSKAEKDQNDPHYQLIITSCSRK